MRDGMKLSMHKDFKATRSLQGLKNIGSDLRLCYACYINDLTRWVHSRLEPIKGSHRAALRIARGVAFVIGISLSIPMSVADSGSQPPYTDLKSLAKYQLTKKQFKCHNQIVFRESTWRDVRNGSHYGYYQIRNTMLINKPYDYHFYFYHKYVSHRYGLDPSNEDVPNYCKALDHLITKGWQ